MVSCCLSARGCYVAGLSVSIGEATEQYRVDADANGMVVPLAVGWRSLSTYLARYLLVGRRNGSKAARALAGGSLSWPPSDGARVTISSGTAALRCAVRHSETQAGRNSLSYRHVAETVIWHVMQLFERLLPLELHHLKPIPRTGPCKDESYIPTYITTTRPKHCEQIQRSAECDPPVEGG